MCLDICSFEERRMYQASPEEEKAFHQNYFTVFYLPFQVDMKNSELTKD